MFQWLFSKPFNPDTDIPDLTGKIILITGGNAGLGKETALQLAKHNPKEVIIACRTESKALAAIEDIKSELATTSSSSTNATTTKLSFLPCDLADLKSVSEAAKSFTSTHDRLDILINNAGIMAVPYDVTGDGFEIQLGTCHVGHALLTNLLLPVLLRTAAAPPITAPATTAAGADAPASPNDVRIINLSSEGHQFARFSKGVITDVSAAQASRTETLYGSAKLANILHARGLKKRYPTLTSTSLHPGVILGTNLFNPTRERGVGNLFIGVVMKVLGWVQKTTINEGAWNTLWCATAEKEVVEKGYYFKPVGSKSPGNWLAQDEGAADRLWEWTNEELRKRGYALPPDPEADVKKV